MTRYAGPLALAVSLSFLTGCATNTASKAGLRQILAAQEFSFPGGKVKDGHLIVDPDVKVEKDPKSRAVFLRRAQGGGLTVDCACFIEGAGFCFAVVNEPPGGPIDIGCANSNCEGTTIDFCVYEIGDDQFKWRFAVAAKD